MKKCCLFLLIIFCLVLFSCKDNNQNEKVSIIVPSGTPALGISNYLATLDSDSYQIVDGADPLRAAFINNSFDIIIAPTNLGALLYNNNMSEYSLYKTIVWGNLYILSSFELADITSLNGKTMLAFSENATPGIILKSIIKYYNIDVTIDWVNDVATANPQFLKGTYDIILSAEPAMENIKNKKECYSLDLQAIWQEMTGSFSYPQASIFVKKSSLTKEVKKTLTELINSINQTEDYDLTATNAIAISDTFKLLGQDILVKAIPNCHFGILGSEKEAVEYYFNKLHELGLDSMYGGKLPDEDFYN